MIVTMVKGRRKISQAILTGEPEEEGIIMKTHVRVLHIQELLILMVTLDGKKKYGIQADIPMQEQLKRLRTLSLVDGLVGRLSYIISITIQQLNWNHT